MRLAVPALGVLLIGGSVACEGAKKYTTTMEIVDIERFGDAPDKAKSVNFEMRYAECPGESRRVLRGDKALAECTKGWNEGDKVKMDISQKWSSDRGLYQTEVLKLGDCPVKEDKKDDSNYEMSSLCTDIKASGAVVGVHCDRSRPKEMTDKCPFLRRR
jgi:hypothetical protein